MDTIIRIIICILYAAVGFYIGYCMGLVRGSQDEIDRMNERDSKARHDWEEDNSEVR